jgi:hypothetical protein
MNHAQYLRDRAAEFSNIALTTSDAVTAQNFHELAILCREGAERLARRSLAPVAPDDTPCPK